MKNMIKVLWYTIISAMTLTMLVLTTAKVFAHGEGRCITDVRGYVKIVSHLTDAELQEFRLTDAELAELEELDLTDAELKKLQDGVHDHGHRKQYYDANGNPTSPSTEFFDKDGGVDKDEFYVDCPTAPPPPKPVTPPRQPQTYSERVRRGYSEQSRNDEEVIQEVIEESSEPEYIPPSPTCDADFSVSEIICWNWQIEDRYQLIGFPVLPSFGLDTIGWLHSSFERKLQRKNILFHVFIDGRWLSYKGGGPDETNPEVGDIPITPHLGILVNFKPKSEESIGLLGTPQEGQIINLEPGIHLIGLPEVPQNYQRASDLVAVDGIEWVRIGYASSIFIRSEDDTDDRELVKGQAVRVSVTEPVTLDLRGTAPAAAPMAPRRGTLATSWGAMKR